MAELADVRHALVDDSDNQGPDETQHRAAETVLAAYLARLNEQADAEGPAAALKSATAAVAACAPGDAGIGLASWDLVALAAKHTVTAPTDAEALLDALAGACAPRDLLLALAAPLRSTHTNTGWRTLWGAAQDILRRIQALDRRRRASADLLAAVRHVLARGWEPSDEASGARNHSEPEGTVDTADGDAAEQQDGTAAGPDETGMQSQDAGAGTADSGPAAMVLLAAVTELCQDWRRIRDSVLEETDVDTVEGALTTTHAAILTILGEPVVAAAVAKQLQTDSDASGAPNGAPFPAPTCSARDITATQLHGVLQELVCSGLTFRDVLLRRRPRSSAVNDPVAALVHSSAGLDSELDAVAEDFAETPWDRAGAAIFVSSCLALPQLSLAPVVWRYVHWFSVDYCGCRCLNVIF